MLIAPKSKKTVNKTRNVILTLYSLCTIVLFVMITLGKTNTSVLVLLAFNLSLDVVKLCYIKTDEVSKSDDS